MILLFSDFQVWLAQRNAFSTLLQSQKIISLGDFINFVSIEIETFKISFWYKKESRNFILFSPEVFTVSKALIDPSLTE